MLWLDVRIRRGSSRTDPDYSEPTVRAWLVSPWSLVRDFSLAAHIRNCPKSQKHDDVISPSDLDEVSSLWILNSLIIR